MQRLFNEVQFKDSGKYRFCLYRTGVPGRTVENLGFKLPSCVISLSLKKCQYVCSSTCISKRDKLSSLINAYRMKGDDFKRSFTQGKDISYLCIYKECDFKVGTSFCLLYSECQYLTLQVVAVTASSALYHHDSFGPTVSHTNFTGITWRVCLKYRLLDLTPRVSDSVDPGWGISKTIPDCAMAADLRTIASAYSMKLLSSTNTHCS